MAADHDPQKLSEATKGGEGEARFWLGQLKKGAKVEEDWRQDAERLVKRYRGEEKRAGVGKRFNVFFSNVELLKPRVYSQTPAVDVRRRRIHEDTERKRVGKDVAKLLERALAYTIDATDFDEAVQGVRDDMLIAGRGTLRLAYKADFARRTDVVAIDPLDEQGIVRAEKPAVNYHGRHEVESERCKNCAHFRAPNGCALVLGDINPNGHCDLFAERPEGVPAPERPPLRYELDGEIVDPDFEDGEPVVTEKANEIVEPRYVFWADFRLSPARRWSDVWWVAFRHAMDADQLKEEFGLSDEAIRKIPLGVRGDNEAGREDDSVDVPDPEHPFSRAAVWEVWNKRTREVIWLAENYGEILRKTPDPLNVAGFFPMPAPLYAIRSTDTMVPRPEFELYRDQADELDRLVDRISNLTRALKAVQFCDADMTEVVDVKTAEDGTMIPVGTSKTVDDIRAGIADYPVGVYANVVQILSQRVRELKHEIYEVTGLSDLARGDTHPRETARAQVLKGEFGQVRMTPRSAPMAVFIRDTLRVMAEIMAEMFDRETLERIGGMPVDDAMMEMLRDERLRNIEIAVATDATVRPDQSQEKAEAVEAIQAIGAFLKDALPIAQAAPQMIPMLVELLKAGIKPFKWSRNIEEQLEDAADRLALAAQEAALQPAPAVPAAPPVPAGNGAIPPGMIQ